METTTIQTEIEELPEEIVDKEYDPNSSERLCSIELPNNNNITIRYQENWTIKDVTIYISIYKFIIVN